MEPAEVDELDGVKTTELVVEKDALRTRANARERRRLARERRALQQSQEAIEAVPSRGAAESMEPEEDPMGAFRHVSPIEALGGAVEAVTDLTELAGDLGAGLGSLMGATDEQTAEGRDFMAQS